MVHGEGFMATYGSWFMVQGEWFMIDNFQYDIREETIQETDKAREEGIGIRRRFFDPLLIER